MTKIAVLGGGSWGTALANVAAENNNDVRLWTRTATQADEINSQHTNQKYLPDAKLSSELMATSNMALAVMDAEIVLTVVPTKVVREVARQLADVLNKQDHPQRKTFRLKRYSFGNLHLKTLPIHRSLKTQA